jgi:REP element-mobilizing transposase RayT
VPWGLYRFHHSRLPHFITFTCYRRQSYLDTPIIRNAFIKALERIRLRYDFLTYGFVVMPNHVHLLISEPKRDTIATVIQSLKIATTRYEKTHICQTRVAHPAFLWPGGAFRLDYPKVPLTRARRASFVLAVRVSARTRSRFDLRARLSGRHNPSLSHASVSHVLSHPTRTPVKEPS